MLRALDAELPRLQAEEALQSVGAHLAATGHGAAMLREWTRLAGVGSAPRRTPHPAELQGLGIEVVRGK